MLNLSPMEQYEIYPLFNIGFTQNNVIFYFQIAGLLSIQVTYVGTYKGKIIPSGLTITHESLFRTILQMVDNFIGRSKIIYFPMIYTIFHIILFSNLQGMIPYNSTPTVEIVMTQSMSFTLQVGVLIQGFVTHKLYQLAAFIPAGTPIIQIAPMIIQEIQAYLTRTLSLGLRQAVNMITGHILVKVCVGFIWVAYLNGTSFLIQTLPIFLLTVFQALEQQIAYLQAYIFTFITCQTFKDMSKQQLIYYQDALHHIGGKG